MKPFSIKTKVTLVATASFLALLALVTAIQMYSVKAEISVVVGDQHYTLVSRVAEEIDQKLEADRQLIGIVSQSISAELIADLDELQKNLDRRAILRSVFDSIFIISAKGYVLVDSPAEGRRGIDISEQENFRQTLATRKPYISQPFLGKTSRKPVVTISAPIFNTRGEIVGLLTGTLNLLNPNVLGSIGNARIGQTGSFALVGRDRTIVVSRDKDRIMTAGPSPGISPYFDHATAGQEGWEEGTNSRGLNAIFSYKPLQTAPWVLIAALPVAEAYAPVLLAQKRIAAVTFIVALLLAPVIWFGTRRILSPLLALRDAIRQMRNDPDSVPEVAIKRHDEIGDLAADFNELMRERRHAENALVASEARLRAVFEQAAVGIATIDASGFYMDVNQRMCDIVRYTREELVGAHCQQIIHPDDIAATLAYSAKRKRGEIENYSHEKRYVTKDRRVVWVHATVSSVIAADGRSSHAISVIEDISERKKVELALRESEGRFRAMIEGSPLGVFVSDTAGNCTYVNDTHRKICGVNSQHALRLDWRTGIHPDDREAADAAWDQAARDNSEFDADLRYLRPDGTVIWAHVRASAFGDGEKALGHVGTAQDITERVQHTEQLELLAHHDVLTGLPNRALFMDRLEQVMLRCVRSHHLTALMYLDIDRFKWINDTFGHAAGDGLLTGFADRIKQSVRASDTVARLGGDEFVILMEGLQRPQDAYNVAQKIIDAMQVAFPIGTQLTRVTTSIGLAFASGAEVTGDGLLKRADAALYDAKRGGRNKVNVAPPLLAEVRASMVTGKATMPPDRSASARA